MAINVFVLAMFSLNGYKHYNRVMLTGFVIAALASLALRGAMPSCGLSGVVFAIYGLLISRCNRLKDYILSAFCVSVTFIPPLNGMLHLLCWATGIGIGNFWHWVCEKS